MSTNLALRSDPAGFGAIQLGTTDVVKITDKGIVPLAGQAPCFSAYSTSVASITTGITKAPLDTEEWDTAAAFDNVTNYRFTPQVAGYYQINASIGVGGTVVRTIPIIRKNGADYKFGTDGPSIRSTVSALVYMNGSTDYVELWFYAQGTALVFEGSNGPYTTWLSGFLARPA